MFDLGIKERISTKISKEARIAKREAERVVTPSPVEIPVPEEEVCSMADLDRLVLKYSQSAVKLIDTSKVDHTDEGYALLSHCYNAYNPVIETIIESGFLDGCKMDSEYLVVLVGNAATYSRETRDYFVSIGLYPKDISTKLNKWAFLQFLVIKPVPSVLLKMITEEDTKFYIKCLANLGRSYFRMDSIKYFTDLLYTGSRRMKQRVLVLLSYYPMDGWEDQFVYYGIPDAIDYIIESTDLGGLVVPIISHRSCINVNLVRLFTDLPYKSKIELLQVLRNYDDLHEDILLTIIDYVDTSNGLFTEMVRDVLMAQKELSTATAQIYGELY